MTTISTTEYILLAALTAFLVCIFSIPSIIKVADMKHLYDEPDERKSHSKKIPTLGGLAMFAGIMIAITLFSGTEFMERRFITCALIIIFFIGMKDDIIMIAPLKKMIGQIIAVCIVVILGKVRLTGFYGFLGIEQIHESLSITLSVFTILVIMNGLNLIDGIDGLAAATGVVISTFFGFWFFINGAEYQQEWALLSFVLAAVLLAFLYYNLTPAKIFMGDTGAMLSGVVNAILVIHFIETAQGSQIFPFSSSPAMGFGILIMPLLDTLRVFAIRIVHGRSPFSPDRNHLHHLLLDRGMNHNKVTLTIASSCIFFIFFTYNFLQFGTTLVILAQIVIFFGGILVLYFIKPKDTGNIKVVKGNFNEPNLNEKKSKTAFSVIGNNATIIDEQE